MRIELLHNTNDGEVINIQLIAPAKSSEVQEKKVVAREFLILSKCKPSGFMEHQIHLVEIGYRIKVDTDVFKGSNLFPGFGLWALPRHAYR